MKLSVIKVVEFAVVAIKQTQIASCHITIPPKSEDRKKLKSASFHSYAQNPYIITALGLEFEFIYEGSTPERTSCILLFIYELQLL